MDRFSGKLRKPEVWAVIAVVLSIFALGLVTGWPIEIWCAVAVAAASLVMATVMVLEYTG